MKQFCLFIFRSSGPVSFGFQSLEELKDFNSLEELMPGSPPDSTNSNTSLKYELNVCTTL